MIYFIDFVDFGGRISFEKFPNLVKSATKLSTNLAR